MDKASRLPSLRPWPSLGRWLIVTSTTRKTCPRQSDSVVDPPFVIIRPFAVIAHPGMPAPVSAHGPPYKNRSIMYITQYYSARLVLMCRLLADGFVSSQHPKALVVLPEMTLALLMPLPVTSRGDPSPIAQKGVNPRRRLPSYCRPRRHSTAATRTSQCHTPPGR